MTLSEHRQAIDKLDEKLVRLLSERTQHVLAIGEIKHAAGEEIYAPHREQAVLDRVARLNPGPMTREQIQAIYREIMSGALALEKTLRIAYLGPEWAFTHQAALRRFGGSLQYVAQRGIAGVFKAVTGGRTDYGVVPAENSSGGLNAAALEIFMKSDLRIVSQVVLRDSSANAARFWVLGRQCSPPTGHDQTSLLCGVSDQSGALSDALAAFRREKINVTRIESRHGRRNREFFVFIDCDGHIQDEKMERALQEFGAHCNFVKILGSYPNAK